jgi:hypothetical protein
MMLSSIPTRRIVLGGALLVTVVASVWPRPQEEGAAEVVAPVTPREVSARREPEVSAPSAAPALAPRGASNEGAALHDLFGAKSWTPPPPTAAALAARKPPPPPPPMAPPFPYVVSGSVVDANGVMVVFSNQQQNVIVRVGEVFEQTYRVDAVDGQSVMLTYLPLGLPQRVAMAVLN